VVCALFLAALHLRCPRVGGGGHATQEVRALMQEIRALKKRVGELEKKLGQTCEVSEANQKKVIEAAADALKARQLAEDARKNAKQAYDQAQAWPHTRSVKASRDVETATKEGAAMVSELGKRLTIHGQVQVEASYESRKPKSGQLQRQQRPQAGHGRDILRRPTSTSTPGACCTSYGRKARPIPVDMDEAFVLVGQTSDMPFYVMAGRIYPAVGLFESYLISDTIAKTLFETQESAAEFGYAGTWFNFSAGRLWRRLAGSQPGRRHPDQFLLHQAPAHEPRGQPGWTSSFPAAWPTPTTWATRAGSWTTSPASGCATWWAESPSAWRRNTASSRLLGEYITALDDFQPGELRFAQGEKARPSAYNLELAYTPWDKWNFAVRYEGGSDLFAHEPERQWGGGVNWTFLPDTILSLEYLRGEYANDDTRDLFTSQLTVVY
jgi:hypothetical protein